MPEENVRLVLRTFDAFNRGDIDATLADVDPAIAFHPSEDFPESGPFGGPEGVRELFSLLLDSFDCLRMDPEEVVDAGDNVAVLVHQSGRGKSSGALVENRYTLLFALRDHRIERITAYRDHVEALRAAGAASGTADPIARSD